MKHDLLQIESDFTEPGYRAICSCGWSSENVDTMKDATIQHEEHVREETIDNGQFGVGA